VNSSQLSEQILFKNDHLVATLKYPGQLSVPGRGDPEGKRPILGKLLEQHLGQQIFPVHRLDFDVGGLLLYALNANAHRKFSQGFENKTIKKDYLAWGLVQEPEKMERNFADGGEWRSRLVKGKKRTFEAEYGKDSLTKWQRCWQKTIPGKQYTLYKLSPETGRWHQLRFEMAKHGQPILGDKLYGSKESWPEGIALFAYQIQMPNELQKEFSIPATLMAKPHFWPSEFIPAQDLSHLP